MESIRVELSEWTRGIRCVFTALVVLPLYYTTRLLWIAPQMGKICEDMLGSKEKLPLLTRAVIQQSESILGIIWLLAILNVILIFKLKAAKHVWITTLLTLLVFILCSHLISAALLVEPLIQIISALSGGS